MQDVISELQDLRYLEWSERANTSGTAGCFLKSREQTGAALVLQTFLLRQLSGYLRARVRE